MLSGGRLKESLQLAQRCKTPYTETVIKEKDGKENVCRIHFGFRPVLLPGYPERQLWLVMVKF